MNNYRVDRADSPIVPCGMNSILYLGDSWAAARKVYAKRLHASRQKAAMLRRIKRKESKYALGIW